jgi:hypothetical protein
MTTTVSRDYADPPEPDDECILRVDRVTAEDDHLLWSFTVEEGAYKGSEVKHRTPLNPLHLWNLRHLLESLGITVPDGPMDLKPDELAGGTLGAAIRKGDIVDFWPVDKPVHEFTHRTRQGIDKARAALDEAIENYVQAMVANSEDIERWRWRARSKAG